MDDGPRGSSGSWVDRVRDRFDAWQQRRPVLGFPIAVGKKYGEDLGHRHAALLTYYAFLSVFPLLLLVTAIMSLVLAGNPELKDQLIDAIVPAALQDTVTQAIATMPSSGIPLAIGIIGLVLSGLGIVNSAYHSLNSLVGVPFRDRLKIHHRAWRTLVALLLLAGGAVGIGALSIVVGLFPHLASVSRAAVFIGTGVIASFVLLGLAELLLPQRVHVSAAWPAMLAGGLVVTALLTFGAILLPRFVARSGPVYGSFATIVGVFALLSLVCQALVISAEAALVRRRRLWPRGLDRTRPLEADRRALTDLVREQERTPVMHATARFDDP